MRYRICSIYHSENSDLLIDFTNQIVIAYAGLPKSVEDEGKACPLRLQVHIEIVAG